MTPGAHAQKENTMYEGLDLAGLGEDALALGKVSAAVIVGATAARFVTSQAQALMTGSLAMLQPYAAAVPIAAGVALYSVARDMAPEYVPGVAAGMVAYGIMKGLVSLATQFAPSQTATLTAYSPFAGVDTYDSRMLAGLGYVAPSNGGGYNQFGVRAYMNGAPVSVQRLNGAPVSVQRLNGIGSAPLTAEFVHMPGAAVLQ